MMLTMDEFKGSRQILERIDPCMTQQMACGAWQAIRE
jgi:hypothetical protein